MMRAASRHRNAGEVPLPQTGSSWVPRFPRVSGSEDQASVGAAAVRRDAGMRGVRKSKRVLTTRSDKKAALPADLVNRQLTVDAPRRFWVCGVTYITT